MSNQTQKNAAVAMMAKAREDLSKNIRLVANANGPGLAIIAISGYLKACYGYLLDEIPEDRVKKMVDDELTLALKAISVIKNNPRR